MERIAMGQEERDDLDSPIASEPIPPRGFGQPPQAQSYQATS